MNYFRNEDDSYNLLKVGVAIVVFLIFVAFLASCSPEKALQRKQNKALDIVTTNPTLLAKAFSYWVESHPQQIDSTVIIIHDTTKVEYEKPVIDSFREKFVIDSLNESKDSLKVKIGLAYKEGIKDADKYYATYPPKPRIDTFKVVKWDLSETKRLSDSINIKDAKIALKQGEIDELNIQVKKADKRLWIFGGLILVFGVVIGLILKAKVPNPVSLVGGLVSSVKNQIK